MVWPTCGSSVLRRDFSKMPQNTAETPLVMVSTYLVHNILIFCLYTIPITRKYVQCGYQVPCPYMYRLVTPHHTEVQGHTQALGLVTPLPRRPDVAITRDTDPSIA